MGVNGCSDGLTAHFSSYENLCLATGGSFIDGRCHCEKECEYGVVCVNGICDGEAEVPEEYKFDKYIGLECSDESQKCSDNQDNLGIIVSCELGKAGILSCLYSCHDNQCGECINGEIKCEDNGIKTCINGSWSDADDSCGEYGCLSDGSGCAACVSDEITCRDDMIQKCVLGTWVQDIECVYGCADDETSCNDCNDLDTRCVDDFLFQECIEGRWQEPAECPPDQTCSKGACALKGCSEDEQKCEHGIIFQCWEGIWSEVQRCSSKQCSVDYAVCSICKDDSTTCTNGVRSVCQSGDWVKTECIWNNAAVSCHDNDCGICKNDDIKCTDGAVHVCSNGEWTVEQCTNGVSCRSETECGECHDGDGKTEQRTIYTCNHGQWEPFCLGLSATSGACENCTADGVMSLAGDKRCVDGRLYSCNGSFWQFEEICQSGGCNYRKNACN